MNLLSVLFDEVDRYDFFEWSLNDFSMSYDCVNKEGKKVGIWIEEEDGLLWVGGEEEGACLPTHLDYLPLMDQSDRSTYDLHPACNYFPPSTSPPIETGTTLLFFPIIPFTFSHGCLQNVRANSLVRLMQPWPHHLSDSESSVAHIAASSVQSPLQHITITPGPLNPSPIKCLGPSPYSISTHPIILVIISHFHPCMTPIERPYTLSSPQSSALYSHESFNHSA